MTDGRAKRLHYTVTDSVTSTINKKKKATTTNKTEKKELRKTKTETASRPNTELYI